ncbi:MAG: TonB family protein [Azoarcus sp.]|jgi:protein TonB|nr:TonB family protein [Azoarcus sp.]
MPTLPPSSSLPQEPPSSQNIRLGVGFAVSTVIHALLLAITFVALPAMPDVRTAMLEVTLVNARHETAPKDPQALAQANLNGGGDNDENVRATSPLPPQESAQDGESLVDMSRGQPKPTRLPQQDMLLTGQQGSFTVATKEDNPNKTPARQSEGGADAADYKAMALKLEAEIAANTQAYNQRPRRGAIAPSTKEAEEAMYFESWRSKAMRIAERNFPAEASRRKLYGTLMMTVSVKKDGSIEKIKVDHPSEHSILNDAAIKIARMGELYPVFPPELTKKWDVLQITSTWTFTDGRIERIENRQVSPPRNPN